MVAGACRDGEGKAFVNGRRPRVLGPVPRVVTLRGGGYFVAPSIPALDELAR